MIWKWIKQRYTKHVKPFDYYENRDRIEKAVNERITISGLKDPKGFTILEGIVIPNIHPVLKDNMSIGGKVFPQIAIVGNSTGIVTYFYLDSLFPGEGLD